MKQYNKLFAILFATLGVTTSAMAQTEIISDGSSLNLQYNFGSPSAHTIPELWTSDARQGFNFSQAVELPNGVYTLSFQMMYRASEDAGTATNCALYAETSSDVYSTPIKNLGDVSGHGNSLDGVTSLMNASDENYKNTIPYFVVTDGRATVGARSLGALTYYYNGYWLIWNPASFKLVSVEDEATLTEALNDLKAEAQEILDAASDSDAKTALQEAYDAAVATSDGVVALKEAIKAYLPSTGTATDPVDVSSLILSADFSQKAFIVATKNNNDDVSLPELQPVGWTCTDGGSGQYNFFNVVDNNATYDGQSNFAYNGKTTGQSLYMRHAWGTADLVAKQTVKFPNGRYKVSIPAIKTGNTATVKYTFAGTTETHDVTTSWAVYEKTFTVNDANNELTIELTYSHPEKTAQRAFFDGVTLLCYGDPIKALLEEISTKASELKSYQERIPQPIYNGYSEHLAAAESVDNTMEEADLQTIVDNLKADIANAETFAVPCDELQDLIDLCTEYTDTENSNANSPEILTALQEAIQTATSAKSTSTTVDAINTAYNDLESARQTYASNAVPVYPYPFDMTFMLSNTTFDSNIDGWTKTGSANWMSAGKNVECYNNTFEFYTEYSGLNPGSWEVSVDGFYRYGGYNAAETAHNEGTEQLYAILYANANEVALKSIMEGANKAGNVGATTTGGVKVPNGPADCDAYFATGCYTNTIATIIADGNLKIGIKKTQTQSSDWTIFDNFKLIYKGVDVTELQEALSALVEKAEPIKDKKMGATESTALTTALTNADASVTDADDLSAMITDLQSAYDDAVVSIAVYEAVPPYITKATNIGVPLADTYQTQYDNGTIEGTAEEVFQALEVATYNYVEKNFSYPVALSDEWESTGTNTEAATFNTEHWSGETREYKNQLDVWSDPKQGYPADSWSIDFDQEVTLPAGDYVFKVAGRKSVDATLELVVTKGEETLGTVNDFPSSNNALGINKEGAASFDADDEAGFANGGNGFGWQWRYVKFTLTEESTVKVAVHAETSKIYNWVSFGDYTLQMTEGTYLEANQDGLNAALEPAQALVGTLPMGEAENTALQTAIDMPVTTGAEMLAKIEALNDAVANANTWRTTYYAEKDKLVAALERFEADYNDAENGALDYMCKSRWATVITEAGEAAVAKDNQTDHTVITAATADLVAALDAATVSVGEYTDLKAAIDNVNTKINIGNVGDGLFQRPQSAVDALGSTDDEQAVYDAAEADGEGVTTHTTALNSAVSTFNSTQINSPTEEQRINIIISADGTDWDGHAATFIYDEAKASDGLFNLKWLTEPSVNYAQAFKFTPVDDKLNTYTLSFVDHLGTTRYLATQKSAGYMDGENVSTRTDRLRITDDAAKALNVEVIPQATDGLWQLKNTEHGACIGYTSNNDLFTQTRNVSFQVAEKAEVTLKFSSVGWATLILPFDAELPSGVTAFSCSEADGEVLELTEAESLKANTPYLMNSYGTEFTFSGYGLADKDSYTDGLFAGTYVDYQTTANSNTYVLQNKDGEVAFYLVGESVQPTVGAYRCYMTYEEATNNAPVFRFTRGGGTTEIDNSQFSIDNEVIIYDLMGRKVTTMEKGGMYIMNGKKVIVK